ncbi:MAG: tetratricopeptide repeat protein, partial [Myxococcota bacterium]|nr:tetratricopeptide repeat protein [Myxococcota bacterium]
MTAGLDSPSVRRFLERSSISNRLVGMLVISVVIPGLVLAWYGVQAVLQEEAVYEATLRERAKELAGSLYSDLGDRRTALIASLDAAIQDQDTEWLDDPARAATDFARTDPLIASVVVFDRGGALRFPSQVASSTGHRSPGSNEDTTHLRRVLSEAEDLEFRVGDFKGAARAYEQARQRISGQRGQAIADVARARCLLKAGSHEAALALYEQLIDSRATELELNDFPIDLLGRYQ